jgi:hypothetical protein
MKMSWDQVQCIAVSFKTTFCRISNTIMSALDGIRTVLIVVRFQVLKAVSMKFTVLRLFPTLKDTTQTQPDNNTTGKYCYRYFKRACLLSTTATTNKNPELSGRVCLAVWTGGPTQHSPSVAVFSLLKADHVFSLSKAHHISLTMNTEPLTEPVSVTHYCMTWIISTVTFSCNKNTFLGVVVKLEENWTKQVHTHSVTFMNIY